MFYKKGRAHPGSAFYFLPVHFRQGITTLAYINSLEMLNNI